jgi:hypothetical protein
MSRNYYELHLGAVQGHQVRRLSACPESQFEQNYSRLVALNAAFRLPESAFPVLMRLSKFPGPEFRALARRLAK